MLAIGLTPLTAHAAEPLVVVSPPELKPPIYNAIATWNPNHGTACLYSAGKLKDPLSPSKPWVTEGDCETWTPPNDLPQGVYDISWDNGASIAPLIVSADPSVTPGAKTLVIVPDYTWQAYNIQGGGSFYFDEDENGKATKKKGLHYSSGLLNLLRPNNFVKVGAPKVWPTITQAFPDVNPIAFLRSNAGAVDVVQQSLLDTENYDLSKYKTIVLYGHDEYWTARDRSDVYNAVSRGTNLLNLAGNTEYRKIIREGETIHFETPTAAHPNTSLWGSRAGEPKPVALTGEKYLGQPYNLNLKKPVELTEAQYNQLVNDGFPKSIPKSEASAKLEGMMVTDAASPIFAGTGLKNGDWFGVATKAANYEIDGVPEDSSGAPLADFTRLLEGRIESTFAETWIAPWKDRGVFESRTGMLALTSVGAGKVFSVGSVGWMACLLRGDRDVQHITLNALKLISDY